jgi:broad specificity phosphatase PhoE
MLKTFQAAIAFMGLFFSLSLVAQPVVYLVRHGEKLDASRDSGLSPAGEARAIRLAQAMEASGVFAIYVTEYRRTSQLAAPLAQRQKIMTTIVPAGDTDGLMKRIAAHGADQVVLVIGHSNTVPSIIRRLGYKGEVKVEEADFDNLFVVVPRESKEPALIRLKY